MSVILGILDPALTELFELPDVIAKRQLETDLAMATLFTSAIAMPDVFLFNNPALHAYPR